MNTTVSLLLTVPFYKDVINLLGLLLISLFYIVRSMIITILTNMLSLESDTQKSTTIGST